MATTMTNYERCCAKRRYVKAYRDAQIKRSRARSAAKRLERAIRTSEAPPDKTIIGLHRQLVRIGQTRVVGPSWRTPRPGRRW